MTSPLMVILDEVVQEREYQDRKWGIQDHEPLFWLAVLMEEVGEVAKVICDQDEVDPSTNYREELIQVAAVAVAAVEALDREYQRGTTTKTEVRVSGNRPGDFQRSD